MVLKNVKYGIEFHFELTGLRCEAETDSENKHYNIIKRRLEKGQWFRTPCLGCSEFPVKRMELVEEFDREADQPGNSSDGGCGSGLYELLHAALDCTIRNFLIGHRPSTIGLI